MLFANLLKISALLMAGSLAAPLAEGTEVARSADMTPREYWAFAFKTRDGNPEKRAKEARSADMSPREYWAFAFKTRDDNSKFQFKTRDGNSKKRAEVKRETLESNCEQASEGIYCSYTTADIEAYGSTSTQLETYCIKTTEGVACFYPNDVLS